MIKVDFHVHTNFSIDGMIKTVDLARKSKELELIPAISDHNTLEGVEEFRKTGQKFIAGEEIRTANGDLTGLFLTENIPKHLSFEETIDKIKEQGGLAYLPHMYDKGRHGCGDKFAELVDIIEVFNARCLDARLNEMASETAKKLGKPGAAGSDSHFLSEFGKTYTEMPEFDIGDPGGLLKALGKAKIVGKKIPFYMRGPPYAVMHWRKLKKKLGLGKDIK
ncbi:PHP domain-containing protein [Candidatus Micrarchaeota archaeon]|nr:PHP domain-containing protein [Candidatus Micrarchaeota archaeon]